MWRTGSVGYLACVGWCAWAPAILAGAQARVDTPPCLALGGLGPNLAPRAPCPRPLCLLAVVELESLAAHSGWWQGPLTPQGRESDQSGFPVSPLWSAGHLPSSSALDLLGQLGKIKQGAEGCATATGWLSVTHTLARCTSTSS